MITYLYFLLAVLICGSILYLLGGRLGLWKAASITTLGVALLFAGFYYFHLEQVFVKRWGGIMTMSTPKGEMHIAVTWKGDNLWVENYNPANNTCYFREYSRGSLLQGEVKISHCNPVAYREQEVSSGMKHHPEPSL